MNNKFAAIVLFGLTMTTCSTPAVAGVAPDTLSYVSVNAKENIINLMETERVRQTMLEARAAKAMVIADNTKLMHKTVKKLKKHVGSTWYVFSGSTPSGWDCSGMTMWFYEQMGVSLEHRATKQSLAGQKTSSPKLGDIVVFKYKGSKSAYHVGIWISEDKMLHAGGKKGDRTEYQSISSFAGNYSKVSYRTLIDTNSQYQSKQFH